MLQKNSHNNLNIKITIEDSTSLYYWKLNQNYSRIPCFVEMKSKQQIQSMVYQKKICGFLLQSTYSSFHYFLQNCVSKNVWSFLDTPPLGNPKSFHYDSKLTRIQNSNQRSSLISPYFKCLVHPRPCNHPIPLTLSPLYFGFRPQNPCKMTKMKWKYSISF